MAQAEAEAGPASEGRIRVDRKISAHQGGGEGGHRPGTVEAYRAAPESGADFVEFDIRRTADGVLVAHHDEHCVAGGRLVAESTFDELAAATGRPPLRVPEVMGMLAGKVAGHLDLKETGYEHEVIDLALDAFGPGNFVATTLEDESVRAIKQRYPGVRTALSLGRSVDGQAPRTRASTRCSELFPMRRIRACGADWIAVDHKLARLGVLRQAAKHGVGVMVWTVDSGRLMDRFLADERVDVLITNRPGEAVRRRAKAQPRGEP
jgi:glycerophosphoryl diester phosphodiesterase